MTAKEDARLIERIAIAIARADERNGAPPYEARMKMGRTVRENLYDEAEAVVDLLQQMNSQAQGMR